MAHGGAVHTYYYILPAIERLNVCCGRHWLTRNKTYSSHQKLAGHANSPHSYHYRCTLRLQDDQLMQAGEVLLIEYWEVGNIGGFVTHDRISDW